VRPQLGAVASVPLKLKGAVVGVLNVAYRRPHVFDENERRMLLGLADISALAIHNAAHHERLARLAVTDDLTGLPNRRRFVETLRAEAQRARRYGRALSLLMLDLDGLKAINDQHGHAAGDAVLRSVALALRASIRETDLAARLSGDEFAVILPETEAEAALRIAERIRAGVAGPAEAGAAAASVSVGVVSANGNTLPDLPRFLRLADEALYQAKAAGRNTISVAPGSAGREAARVAPARSLTSL
jgi:diguanylate cyclase (GGDEF)-like protein